MKVILNCTLKIKHDGGMLSPGDEVDLQKKLAEDLIGRGLAEAVHLKQSGSGGDAEDAGNDEAAGVGE